MPLQQRGVELVVKGFSNFIKSFDQINKLYADSAKQSQNFARSVEKSGGDVVKAMGRLSQATLTAQKAKITEDQAKQYVKLAESIVKATNSTTKLAQAKIRLDIAKKSSTKATLDNERAIQQQQRAVKELANKMAAFSKLTGKQLTINVDEQNIKTIAKMIDGLRIKVIEFERAGKKQTLFFDVDAARFISQEAAIQRVTSALTQLGTSFGTTGGEVNKFAQWMQIAKEAGIVVSSVFSALGVVLSGLGHAFNFVMGVIGSFASAVRGLVSGALNLLTGALQAIGNALNAITRPFFDFINRALSVAAGFLIGDAIRGIGEGFRNMVSDLDEVLSLFQKLEIQFESIAARDIRRDNPAAQMSDVMAQATVKAAGLLDWVKRISVTTPFTARSLTTTLAMASAIGINADMAKRLTLAIGDFTAAMGLTDEHLFRIIYNMGQMLQQGKLNGREFRDLANSFVPVWDILDRMAERAGKTTEEMKKLAFAGKVDVMDFLEVFVEMAETDFPDAAKKMARTWQGVTSNIKDFLEVIAGQEVFGPVFQRITDIAAEILDNLLTSETIAKARAIGYTLLKSFDTIVPAINKLGEAIAAAFKKIFDIKDFDILSIIKVIATIAVVGKRMIEVIAEFISTGLGRLGENLATFANNAYQWGVKIVAALAQGMAAGIAAIVFVINTISRILAHWLKPQSPPRVAPDIDEWGSGTMAQYIEGYQDARPEQGIKDVFDGVAGAVADAAKATATTLGNNLGRWSAAVMTRIMRGWASADFSIFNELADLAENFLRSITDKIGETKVIPMILKARAAIAKAINDIRSGSTTAADAFAALLRKIGRLPSEFKAYALALFEVAEAQKAVKDATEQVEKAQDDLTEVQKRLRKEQDALNAVQEKYSKIIEELRKQLTEVTDEYDEQQRLNEINAAIATGLLTAQERERLEMEKRSILIKRQIRDVEEQQGVEEDAIKDRISLIEREEQAIQDRIEVLEQERDAAQKMLEAREEELDAARAIIEVQIKQNELIQEQLDLLEKLAEAAAGAGSSMGDALSGLANLFEFDPADLMENLTEAFGEDFVAQIDAIFAELEAKWADKNPFEALFKPIEDLAADDMFAPLRELSAEGGPLDQLVGSASNLSDIISNGDWTGFSNNWKLFTDKLNEVDWAVFVENVAEMVVSFAKLADEIDWTSLASGIADIITGLTDIVDKVSTWSEEGEASGGNMISGIRAGMAKEFIDWKVENMLWLYFASPFMAVADAIYMDLVGNSVFPEMMQKIEDVVKEKANSAADYFNAAFQRVVDFSKDPLATTIEWFQNDVLTPLSNYISETLHKVVTKLKEDALVPTFNAFKNIGDYVAETLQGALDTLSAENGPIDVLTRGFKALGEKIEPIVTWFKELVAAVAALNISKIISLIKQFFNIGGGKPDERATGGPVVAGRPYIVGERGPELFYPMMSGFIMANNRAMELLKGHAAGMVTMNVTNNYYVEVNPTYRNVQSEAGVYYDAVAALSAVRR